MATPLEVEWKLRFAAGRPIPADLARDTAMSTKRLSILALTCEGCGECVDHCENQALSVVEGKATVDHALYPVRRLRPLLPEAGNPHGLIACFDEGVSSPMQCHL